MDVLIKASALLRDEFPDLHVAIGGTGRDRRRLERLAKKLSAPVTFLGWVRDEDLASWLGASDLFVMDCRSRWWGFEQEGFGIVFVEAAATGVAQVAGRSGGSSDAVTNGVTGLVVENPRSVESLRAAIASLLNDTAQRNTLAAASRANAVERFDWDALARTLGAGLSPFDHYPI
jgi:phosphatidylinositol alpha-1,6-mannosyltransferase